MSSQTFEQANQQTNQQTKTPKTQTLTEISKEDIIKSGIDELIINEFNNIDLIKVKTFYRKVNKPCFTLLDRVKNHFFTVSDIRQTLKFIGLLYANMIKIFRLNEEEIKEFNKVFNNINNIEYFIQAINKYVKTLSKDEFINKFIEYYNNKFINQYKELDKKIEEFKANNKDTGITFEYDINLTGFSTLSLSKSEFATVSALDLNEVSLNEHLKIMLYSFIIGFLNELTILDCCAYLGLWYCSEDKILYADISIIYIYQNFTILDFVIDDNETFEKFRYNNKNINKLYKSFEDNNKHYNQLDAGILINNDTEKYKIQYITYKNIIEFIKPIFNIYASETTIHYIRKLNINQYNYKIYDYQGREVRTETFKSHFDYVKLIKLSFDEFHKTLTNYYLNKEYNERHILIFINNLNSIINDKYARYLFKNMFEAYNIEFDYKIYNEEKFKFYSIMLYLMIKILKCNNFAFISKDKTELQIQTLTFIKHLITYNQTKEHNEVLLNEMSKTLMYIIKSNELNIVEDCIMLEVLRKFYNELKTKIN